jgi:hypothetical protein
MAPLWPRTPLFVRRTPIMLQRIRPVLASSCSPILPQQRTPKAGNAAPTLDNMVQRIISDSHDGLLPPNLRIMAKQPPSALALRPAHSRLVRASSRREVPVADCAAASPLAARIAINSGNSDQLGRSCGSA